MSYFVALDRLEVLVSGLLLTRGGGEGTPLYEPYMYVPPPKGGVFAPFWSENGYRLCPFWSGIRYGSGGNS